MVKPSKGAKKSRLADQINSLLSGPAPVEQFDPEESELQHNDLADAPSDDDLGDIEDARAPPVRAQEKMRMRADITIDDPRYEGKVVARKKALKQESDDEDSEEEEDEEEDMKEEEEEEEEEQDDDDDEEEEDEDGEEVNNEAEEIEQAQEANIVQLVAVRGGEKEKAQHARHQRQITDLLLESRIRLQKPLAVAARLPRGAALEAFRSRVEGGAEAVAGCVAEVKGLLQDLTSFRASLCKQNTMLPDPSAAWRMPHAEEEEEEEEGGKAGRKRARRECEDVWACIAAAERDLVPFRDATVDKWNSKVSVTAGGGGVGTKFKALNQSILSQTQQVLQDMDRLVRRTRVKRSKYEVIGAELLPEREEEGAGEDEEAEGGGGRRTVKEEVDEEVYDDTDFYQLLLRDLLESSAASSAAAADLQAQLRAARRKAGKAGKTVDTKASKGRKLRYDVQPKLVNFMFPIPDNKPTFADALFEHLFKA